MSMIHLRAPVALKASADTSGLPSKFEGIAYSGGLVPSHNAIIDLSTLSMAPRLPLLLDHIRDKIVGTVESAAVVGGQLLVDGRLFSDMPGGEAERIARYAQRGAPYMLSVGLYNYSEEQLPPGSTAQINSQQFVGPAVVMRNGLLREVSICVLGADHGAHVKVFSSTGRIMESAKDIYARRAREAAACRR